MATFNAPQNDKERSEMYSLGLIDSSGNPTSGNSFTSSSSSSTPTVNTSTTAKTTGSTASDPYSLSDLETQRITRQEDRDALIAVKKRYMDGQAAGNTYEMQMAQKNAKFIRAAYGLEADSDGSNVRSMSYSNPNVYNPTYITGSPSVTRGSAYAYDSTPWIDYSEAYAAKNNGKVDWNEVSNSVLGKSNNSTGSNGSSIAANLATGGGMNYNFVNTGSSSAKDNYINNLMTQNTYSNPYKNTPFSRFVNQNLYADRYF